ncbi:MAG: HAD family phosphatase [Candidatus Omnitrophota bacterium]
MPKQYDLILCDLGNVVVKFDHRILARKISRLSGRSTEELYDLFFDSALTRLHDEGKITSREFHERVNNLLGIHTSFDFFKKCWNHIFFTNPGMARIIKDIRRQHMVYLMSNTNRLHFEYIRERFSVINSFDHLVLSYKVGAMKPDKIIYRYALRRAGVSAARTLYIDDRADLIEGGRKLGITGVVFCDPQQLRHDLRKKGVL